MSNGVEDSGDPLPLANPFLLLVNPELVVNAAERCRSRRRTYAPLDGNKHMQPSASPRQSANPNGNYIHPEKIKVDDPKKIKVDGDVSPKTGETPKAVRRSQRIRELFRRKNQRAPIGVATEKIFVKWVTQHSIRVQGLSPTDLYRQLHGDFPSELKRSWIAVGRAFYRQIPVDRCLPGTYLYDKLKAERGKILTKQFLEQKIKLSARDATTFMKNIGNTPYPILMDTAVKVVQKLKEQKPLTPTP